MSTATPTTPVRKVATNRSFTVPVKSTLTSRTQPFASEIGAAEGIETLYAHPNAKIVKFSSGSSSRPGSSNEGQGSQVEAGTLSWATITEQTLAAGPMEIYRVPGSVSFLHSGSLLHAIMPRSNCWCVDGVSKFAMRVLTDTYYRIELPGESQEELEKVEIFKEILQKVLFYERTPCPFARTFTVDLPEEEPVRKKRRSTHGPAKKWTLASAYSWKPEDGREQSTSEEDQEEDEEPGRTTGDEEEDIRVAEDVLSESDLTSRIKELSVHAPLFKTPPGPSVRDRVRGISMRSVTAPVHSTAAASSPSPLKMSFPANVDTTDAQPETSESRMYQAIPTNMPPSPPDSSTGFEYTELIRPESTLHSSSVTQDENASSVPTPSEVTVISRSLASPSDTSQTTRNADTSLDPPHLDQPSASIPDSAPASIFQPVQRVTSQAGQNSTVDQPEVSDYNEWMEVEPIPQKARVVTSSRTKQTLELRSTRRNVTVSTATLAQAPHADQDPSEDLPKDPLPVDPFAQIQARIQARRSIGGTTTSFVPPDKSPTRQSSFSTASSTRSSLSRHSSAPPQNQQAVATALVRKACAAFLGPPAHLVVLMLKIAARFARGVFPPSLIFSSPRGSVRRVPGSFDLDDVYSLDSEDEMELEGDDLDDFGVPIESPVRLAAGLRERKTQTGDLWMQ